MPTGRKALDGDNCRAEKKGETSKGKKGRWMSQGREGNLTLAGAGTLYRREKED